MAREVITKEDVEDFETKKNSEGGLASGTKKELPVVDEYRDRLIKYIPAEIVTLYLFVNTVLVAAVDQIPRTTLDILQWCVFGIMLILTFLYQRFTLNIIKKAQLLIGIISFAIWVFTLGGPFTNLSWYHPVYGTLLLPIYTFSIALYIPKNK